MHIRTFSQLTEWARTIHANLALCLAHCALRHHDETASSLLDYLSSHQAEVEKMLMALAQRAEPKAAHTYLYDCIPHTLITTHMVCDGYYSRLNAEAIKAEVFDFHLQIISLYRALIGREKIQEAVGFMQALIDIEEHETQRLARQFGHVSWLHGKRLLDPIGGYRGNYRLTSSGALQLGPY